MRFTFKTVQLCLAIALFATVATAGKYDHMFNTNPAKDSRCHGPVTHRCQSSIYPIMKYTLSAWFFHQPFHSCRPLYSAGGVNNCTGNMDLPLTREECEELCGEVCTASDGRKGLCSMAEHCQTDALPSRERVVCNAYGVECCDRIGDPNSRPSNESSTATTREPIVDADNVIADDRGSRRFRY